MTTKISKVAAVLAGLGTGAWLVSRLLRERQRMNFDQKVVVITGASRGLGLVMAHKFGAEGARLAILARSEDELERARAELLRQNIPTLAVTCDVSQPQQVVDAINEVQQVYGHIDVLVNNASSMQVGPLEHMTLDDFEKAMGVHFWGAYYTSMAVIPIMKSQGGGRIVNVTSVGARMAVPHLAPYTASKFATAGLSDALRAELTKDNILVSTLYPGLMRTGSPLRASFKGDYEKEFAWFAILDSIPLLTISADHAAAAAVDAARFGTAARTLGLPAKAGALVEELVPGLFAAITAQIGRLMPGPTGSTGDQPRLGLESQSGWSRTFTGLTQAAAVRNNQVPGKEQTET